MVRHRVLEQSRAPSYTCRSPVVMCSPLGGAVVTDGEQEEHASTQSPVFGTSTDNRVWRCTGPSLGAVHAARGGRRGWS